MKFMKLGNRPDTFYTEEATRTVTSDVPSDLTIRINNTTYLLHKYPLLPKCGLLQRLYTESDDSTNTTIDLTDIPGGEEAFELCAKFCYGITINLSAHNFVSALCAAKFLRMTEAVENGNFLVKLEAFFSSCILESWKDPILTLQNTDKLYELSENLGIVRRCIESIVDKILTPPTKVTWSYTYTRKGYEKKHNQSAPKDWWTEDISFLNIDMFRSIVAAIKSTNTLPPQLIGESLHVYACRWLPEITGYNNKSNNEGSTSRQTEYSSDTQRNILETIVSLIPPDYKGSVSIKFLLRLLTTANFLAVSAVTKAELLRMSGLQLDEAVLDDLLLPSQSYNNDQNSIYDIDLVQTVLESFLRRWKRQTQSDESHSLISIRKIGKLVDSYLQVVAKDAKMHVHKFASLAETLPEIARLNHDDLYMAINIYLKEHPDLSKTDKKEICRVLDCKKLSPEVRSHAVRNERLPLRTVVQVLFFEQEKVNSRADKEQISQEQLDRRNDPRKLKSTDDELSLNAKGGNRSSAPGTSTGVQENLRMSDDNKLQLRQEKEKGVSGIKLNSREKAQMRRIYETTYR